MQIHKARNILLLTRHCERRKVRGNPFSFKGNTDSFALCTQNDTPFSYHECRKVCAVSCCLVIASTVRCAAIRFSFETPTQAEIVIRFVLNLRNKKALIPVKHYGDIKAFKFILSYMCHIA